MPKIFARNTQHNGLTASVQFVNGVGETDNPKLLKWFRERGYKIEGEEQEEQIKPDEQEELQEDQNNNEGEEQEETFDIDGLTVEQLKAYAAENNIDLTGKRTKMEILQAIYGQQGE